MATLVAPMGNIKFEVINDCKRDPVFPYQLKLHMNDRLVLDKAFTIQKKMRCPMRKTSSKILNLLMTCVL